LTSLILLLPLIGIIEVILSWQGVQWLEILVYLEMVVICLCGYLGMTRPMWLLLTLFYTWVIVTDRFIAFSMQVAAIEAVIFGMLVYWVYKRPENIHSDTPSDTVQVAFYKGLKYPFIAKLCTLFSYNVTGIAVVINDTVMMVRGKTGIIEKRARNSLNSWVIIDTYIKPDYKMIGAFLELEGDKVGYGGCMKAMKPVLNLLGDKRPLCLSPAAYMEQLL